MKAFFKKIKPDYSWVIISICFLVVFTSLGFCSSGRTMYLTAITDALGLKRSAFSLNDTFRFITTTIVNLFFGTLIGKFGSKKLICAGFVCLIGFSIINSVATELWMFYIGGILLGIGLSWTSTTMMSAVVKKVCKSNQGTATGAILAANGIGGAVAAQIASPLIFMEGNPFGYRIAYNVVSIVLASVLVLVLIFYKDPPKDSTDAPIKSKKKIRGAGWSGMEFSTAVKKPYFYVALLSMFLTGMVLQGLGGIATPHMYDIGIDPAFVSIVVSVSGILLTTGKFLTGFFYDRFGIKITTNLALICAFCAMLSLVFLTNTTVGRILAFVRVFVNAFAMPLETVMLPLFAVEFFGNKAFDKVIGIFSSASTAGFAVGAPFANMCFDLFGDYRIAFLVFAILMVIVTIALHYVLIHSSRDRKEIEQQSNVDNVL